MGAEEGGGQRSEAKGAHLGQRCHSDSVRLNNREVAGPVLSTFDGANDNCGQTGWIACRDSEKDDSRCGAQPGAKCQFAEVLIERDNDSLFVVGSAENLLVRAAWGIGVNPCDVMAALSERLDYLSGNVLVSQYPHQDA